MSGSAIKELKGGRQRRGIDDQDRSLLGSECGSQDVSRATKVGVGSLVCVSGP